MNSGDVRDKYLKFFEEQGHKKLPSSSLVPENDTTTLFTSAGMQPLLPYLLGKAHPLGERLVDSQRCFRAQDIEEVGDNRHDTFFEMLGNWSLGDYFKKEQLGWFFEFLTKELLIDPKNLYVTVFAGDEKNNLPRDEESATIWRELFSSVGIEADDKRISYYDAKKNWWSRSGEPDNMPTGEPGGPSSEVFFEFTDIPHHKKYGESCHPNCDCGRFAEIGNSVFMQYMKQGDDSFQKLPKNNVDFGGGLERLLMAANNQADMFKLDLHWPIIEKLSTEIKKEYGIDEKTTVNLRVIADHIKAAVFLIKDGVLPSNKLQGYILRRLLRRAATKLHLLSPNSMAVLAKLADPVLDIYADTDYFETGDWEKIRVVVEEEINKFQKTLEKGLKEIEKNETIDGKVAFDLYQTYGFPVELTLELLAERGQKLNLSEFQEEVEKHQQLSRELSAQVFKEDK